ncbi:N-terminal kinase-like protein [Linum perenne]
MALPEPEAQGERVKLPRRENAGIPQGCGGWIWDGDQGSSLQHWPTLPFRLGFLDSPSRHLPGSFNFIADDDGSVVSIFCLSGSSALDGHLAAGRNELHPNILSFLHSTELEAFYGSVSRVTLYMVTELVIPLSEKIKVVGLEGTQRDEYYAWGLNQTAKAVSFLNNDCKLDDGSA